MKLITNNEELYQILFSMLDKIDGVWTCKVCGKKTRNKMKQILISHIQGVFLLDPPK